MEPNKIIPNPVPASAAEAMRCNGETIWEQRAQQPSCCLSLVPHPADVKEEPSVRARGKCIPGGSLCKGLETAKDMVCGGGKACQAGRGPEAGGGP